jgi:hypothetical protein
MTLSATPHARGPRHQEISPAIRPANRQDPPPSPAEPGTLRQSPTPKQAGPLPAGSSRAGHASAFPARQIPSGLIRLCALRVVQDGGPIGGLDALNLLAPLARMLGEAPPTFPLLHDLEDCGLLEASTSLPRTYAITASGRREATRLASSSSALLAERLGTGVRLEAMLARRH